MSLALAILQFLSLITARDSMAIMQTEPWILEDLRFFSPTSLGIPAAIPPILSYKSLVTVSTSSKSDAHVRQKAMNPSHGCHAPSFTLLRFLRCQLDAQSPTVARRTLCSSTLQLQTSQKRHYRTVLTAHRLGARCASQPRFTNHDRVPCQSLSSAAKCNQQTSWHQWRSQRSPPKGTRYEDLPRLQGFLENDAGLGGRTIKPGNELRLRCTEFDENGNVTLVNGEFRKSELTAKYSLLPRDLRKIDSSVLPHILVRRSAILINLLHLRCLIKHNRVLVFDVYGSTDSYAQSLFMYDLEGKLRQKQSSSAAGGLPYEFRALEAVLVSVTNGLESEFDGVREPVVRVLRELEEDIDRDKLRHLLIYSKKLGTFEQKARLVRDAIEDLLEADDDLASMYLTEKNEGKERDEDNHEEAELMLESYHKVADEIVQVSSNLVSAIRNTEEIVRAILDANRNSLMLLDLKFSIGTLGISAGMFIAALYGMNLQNFIEESDVGFFGVSASCVVLTIFGITYGLRKLRSVQRISMWGEGGLNRGRERGSRGSWRQIESHSGDRADVPLGEAVAGIKRADRMRWWKQAHEERLAAMQHAGKALPPVSPK